MHVIIVSPVVEKQLLGGTDVRGVVVQRDQDVIAGTEGLVLTEHQLVRHGSNVEVGIGFRRDVTRLS